MDKKRSFIRNTTEDMKGPEAMLWVADAMGGRSAGDLIEDQEAKGQRQLVADVEESGRVSLPTQGSEDPCWKEMGVDFGGEIDGDPLFRNAYLPDGWKVEATDHSMWSKLVDAEGNERASIFYKAAFYDRGALIRPTREDA